jgi:hypothetical protein
MALINCPECGQSVSDQANSCIKCGFPLKGTPNNVMISFPVWQGQIINNYCKVLRDGREIAGARQGETVTFDCNEPFEIEIRVGGAFGRPSTIVNPGDRYKVAYRGFGKIFLSKVENLV